MKEMKSSERLNFCLRKEMSNTNIRIDQFDNNIIYVKKTQRMNVILFVRWIFQI